MHDRPQRDLNRPIDGRFPPSPAATPPSSPHQSPAGPPVRALIRSLPARLAAATLAFLLTLAGLATPAWAATTGGITGRFVSASGSPLAATVTLYDSSESYVDSVEAGTNGRYRFTGLPVDTYKLEFNAAGRRQWARQKTDMVSADPIAVVAGQDTTVDETQVALGALTGRLVDAAGQPVAWAVVAVAHPDTDEWEWITDYTDDDGRYRVQVIPGQYQVQFQLSGGARQWVPGKRIQSEGTVFTVAAGAEVVVDETAMPAGSISGQVRNYTGQPVSGIQVTAHDGDLVGGYAFTDEEGRYTMSTVFPGRYKLSFELPNRIMIWAHGAPSEDAAQVFTVAVGAETVVDEVLLTGSIAGRLSRPDGTAAGGADVMVSRGEDIYLSTETDASGSYRIDDLPAADGYLVAFRDWRTDRFQYAYGKLREADADRITVVAGETSTVNDTQLAGGELRVRAIDKVTGAATSGFCVSLNGPTDRNGCAKGTELVLTDVSPGEYSGFLDYGESGFYLNTSFSVTIASATTATVDVPVTEGGVITVVATDAATGQPVADVCVMARTMASGVLGEGGGNCTDSQGKVKVDPVAPGTYTLFASARRTSSYGHQWVGAAGGTGNQQEAAKVVVKAGKSTAAPAVRMDRAGTVSGVVTLADTGQPVSGGHLGYSAWGFGAGPSHCVDINAAGRYTLNGLGPYDWPLYAVVPGVAPQWSGGVGNRFKATKITVRSGETTTYSPALETGSLLLGTMSPASGDLRWSRLTAYNAVTGDPIGVTDTGTDGAYEMRVLGPQPVYLGYEWSTPADDYFNGWYDGASSQADATRVSIPTKGKKTLNITLR